MTKSNAWETAAGIIADWFDKYASHHTCVASGKSLNFSGTQVSNMTN
jgi:hypothetical protein